MSDETHQRLDDLRDLVSRGFDDLRQQLTLINGRVRANEQAVSVLQDRSERVGRTAAHWGTGAGAAIAAVISGLMALFGGAK